MEHDTSTNTTKTASGYHAASSEGTATTAPSAADSAQSSTAAALIDSLNASARLHQPPRGIGRESQAGSGPSAGMTLSNIMADSGQATGKGPNRINAAGPSPAAADPAQTSTSAGMTEFPNASSKLSPKQHSVSRPSQGNLENDSGQPRQA